MKSPGTKAEIRMSGKKDKCSVPKEQASLKLVVANQQCESLTSDWHKLTCNKVHEHHAM